MLAALGIVAVGCTSSSAFTQADADRFTLLSHLTSSVPESLEPILLPPSRPHPAPLGLISHNTLPLQQQPSSMSLPAERQRSGSLAATANSAGSRGRPAKQPKLSSMGCTHALSYSIRLLFLQHVHSTALDVVILAGRHVIYPGDPYLAEISRVTLWAKSCTELWASSCVWLADTCWPVSSTGRCSLAC